MHGGRAVERDLADWCGDDVAQVEKSCAGYMVTALGAGRIDLLDGAIELIASAADRVPVGLASAAPRRFVDAAVNAFGLARYLKVIVYADQVANGKPAPDIYLRSAERLDSGSGILAAHAAGMQVLAIPNPAYPPPPQALRAASHRADSTTAAVKILIGIIDQSPGPEQLNADGRHRVELDDQQK
jgi:beta-phosphoglucomutase-like phosphatase (HAD superfamily)